MFEIETATLAIIAAAQKSLYIESQYFASRRIAEAMAVRLREPDGPEIVLINPKEANGWLESKTMDAARRSEEHTSELQSLMRISYADFYLKKKKKNSNTTK